MINEENALSIQIEIDNLVSDIYEGRFEDLFNRVTKAIEKLQSIIKQEEQIKGIIKYIVLAMENVDYQLLADILQFEVKKFVEES